MKILSLFDGISIARQAIANCGIKIEKYYASEIDKDSWKQKVEYQEEKSQQESIWKNI